MTSSRSSCGRFSGLFQLSLAIHYSKSDCGDFGGIKEGGRGDFRRKSIC